MDENDNANLQSLTADIVAAHVSHNTVAVNDMPALIANVHNALKGLVNGAKPEPELIPAVPIRASIKRDYIICLEDGKRLKTLRRHLRVHYNMTAEDYREKWRLPKDYPMVAPSYSEHRRDLAKSLGLGRKTGRKR
jgi:predicted transcriptional regulator